MVSAGRKVDSQQVGLWLTFCLVYDPAPGHSVMMSSFASLFVANANATPEKVVPWGAWVSGIGVATFGRVGHGSSLQNQCQQSVAPCSCCCPRPRQQVWCM